MKENAGQVRSIRFGPFVADMTAGELRKNGRKVPLQEQPFQVLAALLDRPGDVVTREDLRDRLWPGQPFVDVDQGLNTAIAKIRDALGDSAASARFVETLPRRGYRFTFPVDPPESSTIGPLAAPPAVVPMSGFRHKIKSSRTILTLVGACLLLAGMSLHFGLRQPGRATDLPLRRFEIRSSLTSLLLCNRRAAISPDGSLVAFVSDENPSRLWIRRFDQEQPHVIEGTEGVAGLFWSQDSKSVGFATRDGLKRVSPAGGAITPIAALSGIGFFGATWSHDGSTIVFADGGPSDLYEVPATGGTPRVVVSRNSPAFQLAARLPGQAPTPAYLLNPHFLPAEAGRRVIVFSFGYASSKLAVRDLQTGRTEILGPGRFAAYSPTGHLVYESSSDSNEIWVQPFSLTQLQTSGAAFRIARNGSEPTVSTDGTLIYVDSLQDSHRLVRLDRNGRRLGLLGSPQTAFYYPAISPNGQSVAVETLENHNLDIWVYDAQRGSRTRITTDVATDILPVWSPDGKHIAYTSYQTGQQNIFLRRADASTEPEILTAAPGYQRVSDWSRDGRYILFYAGTNYGPPAGPDHSTSLQYLAHSGKGGWDPHVFLRSRFALRAPKLSPDGKYVAYLSNETGRDELHVRPFPNGERQWVVSRNGAAQPHWSGNGRELFYVEAGTLMAVPVQTASGFSAGSPAPLFHHAGFGPWPSPTYDVSATGEDFLLPERLGAPTEQRTIRVVQNWFAEFRHPR